MIKKNLESNVKMIIKLAEDLINCEDEDVSYFGEAISSMAERAFVAIDDYTPSRSYDHSEYKESRYN